MSVIIMHVIINAASNKSKSTLYTPLCKVSNYKHTEPHCIYYGYDIHTLEIALNY